MYRAAFADDDVVRVDGACNIFERPCATAKCDNIVSGGKAGTI